MANSPNEIQGANEWDRMLTKYVYVWLWSILVGTAASLAYSFLWYEMCGMYRLYQAGRCSWIVLGPILGLGTLALLASLYLLASFFTGFLLPLFFAPGEIDTGRLHQARVRLAWSVQLILAAVFLRLLVSGVGYVLSLITRM